MTAVVVNVRGKPPGAFDVYIGRPIHRSTDPRIKAGSIWANPFKIDGLSRDESIARYEAMMRERLAKEPALREELMKLAGKRLGCWCHPQTCHGDVLVKLLSEGESDSLLTWYLDIKEAVIQRGFAEEIDWAQSIKPVANSRVFAEEAIYVVCNSGMKAQVARTIYEKAMACLEAGTDIEFGHTGKAKALAAIWRDRDSLFASFQRAADKVSWCQALPWIGPVTKYHLAKNLGVDCVKPDRHLERVAAAWGYSPDDLCRTIAARTGERLATVDTAIWRACNLRIVDSRALEAASQLKGGANEVSSDQ